MTIQRSIMGMGPALRRPSGFRQVLPHVGRLGNEGGPWRGEPVIGGKAPHVVAEERLQRGAIRLGQGEVRYGGAIGALEQVIKARGLHPPREAAGRRKLPQRAGPGHRGVVDCRDCDTPSRRFGGSPGVAQKRRGLHPEPVGDPREGDLGLGHHVLEEEDQEPVAGKQGAPPVELRGIEAAARIAWSRRSISVSSPRDMALRARHAVMRPRPRHRVAQKHDEPRRREVSVDTARRGAGSHRYIGVASPTCMPGRAPAKWRSYQARPRRGTCRCGGGSNRSG
jgi:hypothetical protein